MCVCVHVCVCELHPCGLRVQVSMSTDVPNCCRPLEGLVGVRERGETLIWVFGEQREDGERRRRLGGEDRRRHSRKQSGMLAGEGRMRRNE